MAHVYMCVCVCVAIMPWLVNIITQIVHSDWTSYRSTSVSTRNMLLCGTSMVIKKIKNLFSNKTCVQFVELYSCYKSVNKSVFFYIFHFSFVRIKDSDRREDSDDGDDENDKDSDGKSSSSSTADSSPDSSSGSSGSSSDSGDSSSSSSSSSDDSSDDDSSSDSSGSERKKPRKRRKKVTMLSRFLLQHESH